MTDKKAEEKAALDKVNDPDRPEQNYTNKAVDPEMISHNYQHGSPAYDLSYPGVSEKSVNTVAEARKAEVAAKDKGKEKISQAEYDRRTKLDVSSFEYINPSTDHYEVK